MVTTKKENKEEPLKTGERFRKIAEVLFDGNKSALARALNMKPGSFTKYLRGARTPGASVLERLTQMGVNLNWFLTGKGPMLLSGEEAPASPASDATTKSMSTAELQDDSRLYHPIPPVQVRLAEDGNLELDEVGEPEWVDQTSIRKRYGIEPKRIRDFRVSDNRMADTIRAGDRVRTALLPPDVSVEDLNEGAIYLLFGPDGVFFARVFGDDAEVQLVGDNPEGTDHSVPVDMWGEKIRPIARVLEIIRPV